MPRNIEGWAPHPAVAGVSEASSGVRGGGSSHGGAAGGAAVTHADKVPMDVAGDAAVSGAGAHADSKGAASTPPSRSALAADDHARAGAPLISVSERSDRDCSMSKVHYTVGRLSDSGWCGMFNEHKQPISDPSAPDRIIYTMARDTVNFLELSLHDQVVVGAGARSGVFLGVADPGDAGQFSLLWLPDDAGGIGSATVMADAHDILIAATAPQASASDAAHQAAQRAIQAKALEQLTVNFFSSSSEGASPTATSATQGRAPRRAGLRDRARAPAAEELIATKAAARESERVAVVAATKRRREKAAKRKQESSKIRRKEIKRQLQSKQDKVVMQKQRRQEKRAQQQEKEAQQQQQPQPQQQQQQQPQQPQQPQLQKQEEVLQLHELVEQPQHQQEYQPRRSPRRHSGTAAALGALEELDDSRRRVVAARGLLRQLDQQRYDEAQRGLQSAEADYAYRERRLRLLQR